MQALEIGAVNHNNIYNMASSFDFPSKFPTYRFSGPSSFLPTPSSSPPNSYQHTPTSSVIAAEHLPYLSTSRPRKRPCRTTTTFDNFVSQRLHHISPYLSPPKTNSFISHSHPLPGSLEGEEWFLGGRYQAGGILDSPLVMRQDELTALDKASQKPLSPPLTLPMTNLTLPDTEGEYTFPQDSSRDSESGPTSPSVGDDEDHSLAERRKDTLSNESEESLTDLLRQEGRNPTSLSPLSPSWMNDLDVVHENSALLGSSSLPARRSRSQLSNHSRFRPYVSPTFNSSPPWSPQSHDVGFPMDLDDAEDRVGASGQGLSSLPTHLPSVSNPITGQSSSTGSETLPTPVSLYTPDLGNDAFDFWHSPEAGPSYQLSNKPFLHRLDIPESSYDTHPSATPDIVSPLFDEEYSMAVDSPPGASRPYSPHCIDPLAPLPPAPLSWPEPPPSPSSPLMSRLNLPDLDDESHPESPSRRSYASLPDLDMDDSLKFDAPQVSPSHSLLSLPGADTDDELLPPLPSNFKTPTPPQIPASRLLFIDDPRDVPLPRSPSPEDFDLTLVLDDDADPELTKLYNLHKKSLAAERAARHAEAQLIDAGSVTLRAEATREKKKNKERSKELGALLRIKLGDQVTVPEEKKYSKGMMNGISHLVARMMFKRNEAARPLAHRRAGSKHGDYVKSSLSRSRALT